MFSLLFGPLPSPLSKEGRPLPVRAGLVKRRSGCRGSPYASRCTEPTAGEPLSVPHGSGSPRYNMHRIRTDLLSVTKESAGFDGSIPAGSARFRLPYNKLAEHILTLGSFPQQKGPLFQDVYLGSNAAPSYLHDQGKAGRRREGEEMEAGRRKNFSS